MKKFRQLTFSKQIILYYGCLFAIAIFGCGIAYFSLVQSTTTYAEKASLKRALLTVDTNFESMLDRAADYSKIIGFSEGVQSALREGEERGANLKIDKSITQLISGTTFISSVYIFDNYGNKYSISNEYMGEMMIKDIKEAAWYHEVVKKNGSYIVRMNPGRGLPDIVSEKKDVSLVRVINDLDTQKPIGIIMVNIAASKFSEIYASVQKEFGVDIMMLDESGSTVISSFEPGYYKEKEFLAAYETSRENYEEISARGEAYRAGVFEVGDTGWRILGVISRKENMKDVLTFGYITLFIIILTVGLLCLGAVYITRMMSIPINRLLKSMGKVDEKRFEPVEEVEVNREMNHLQAGYNSMTRELDTLFAEVLREQKMKRKYELDVLQAQIKPHFLYNTFDSVAALALMERSKDVFIMMQALGKYYRTSLHKGQEIITINEEIKIIKSYLIIQKYRYEDVFEASYELDESVGQYKVLKLILQPFVENAIYHGLKMAGYCGNIIVRAKDTGDTITLQVEDDGIGMPPETVQAVLAGTDTGEGKSFGVHGTVERIHLFYDREDLVTIQSDMGKGTVITVRIPKAFDVERI